MTKLFQPRHFEVAVPQQDRFMQNLVCCPDSGSSESINFIPQGNPLSRACSSLRLHNHDLSLDKGRGKKAFTLAEVLITLAIIGVVAAMTIPTLIAGYNKQIVETRLAKFYSSMNQSINLSTVENGPTSSWQQMPAVGSENLSYESALAWFNKYLASYLKYSNVEEDSEGNLVLYFSDGSLVKFAQTMRDMIFYVNPGKCYKNGEDNCKLGIDKFQFRFSPVLLPDDYVPNHKYSVNPGLEPYLCAWDGTREDLLSDPLYGCNSTSSYAIYCTKLIQMNNWKIPEDYPFGF